MRPGDLGDSPILVDTDVFSFVVWNRGPAAFYEPFLVNRIWVLSFATVAELRYGAHKARWGETKRADLERRIQLCVVVPGDNQVVDHWVDLTLNYKDQIGVNDLWVAACALSQSPALAIATNDGTLERIGTELGLTVVRQRNAT